MFKDLSFRSCKILSASGLAWQSALKRTEVKLELLTDIDMLLIENRIRGGICHAITRYAKADNKDMKDYDKNEELGNVTKASSK